MSDSEIKLFYAQSSEVKNRILAPDEHLSAIDTGAYYVAGPDGKPQAVLTATTSDQGVVNLIDPRDGMPMTPSDFGWDIGGGGSGAVVIAPGDGVNSDHVAIESARDSAGVGGMVAFMAGTTYVLDRTVRFLLGQTVVGNGAKLIRAPQAVSTTATSITSDVTKTISVAAGDGIKFKVGQWLNVYSGGVGGSLAVKISNISGDTITCSSAFRLEAGGTWAGGATVAASGNLVELMDGCSLVDLILDGNTTNAPYASWQTNAEVQMRGQDVTVYRCTIQNASGEGIVETGVSPFTDSRNKIAYNVITGIKGNGVHLSASWGCQVVNNYMYDCNSNGAAVGHSGGCITLSNYVTHALIANNHLELGRAGVGQVDSNDNSIITISGNTVLNMSTYMIECRGNTIALNNIKIVNNRFYNDTAPATSELISVSIEDVGNADYFREIVVAGNTFRNAGLVLRRVDGCSVTANSFSTTYQAVDTYHNPIRITNGVNTVIASNVTKYGYSGLQIYGDHASLNVIGNTFNLGYYFGISITGGAGNSLVSFTGNNVLADANVNVSYQGIVVGANTTVKGNNIKMVAGHSGIRVYGTPNCVVQGNTVRSYAAGKTIRVESGSTGYIVVDNQVTHAVTDAPAVGVRVANNDIIV